MRHRQDGNGRGVCNGGDDKDEEESNNKIIRLIDSGWMNPTASKQVLKIDVRFGFFFFSFFG